MANKLRKLRLLFSRGQMVKLKEAVTFAVTGPKGPITRSFGIGWRAGVVIDVIYDIYGEIYVPIRFHNLDHKPSGAIIFISNKKLLPASSALPMTRIAKIPTKLDLDKD